jgi:SAM-dependent methyltransferase
LRKIQCLDCGLLRQLPHSEATKREFYRDKYAFYHQRPGTSDSEISRYSVMADWILAELAPFSPRTVLDVGCGGGYLLDAIRRIHPAAEFAGIDPSIQNTALARDRGFAVVTGQIPGAQPPGEVYDLVLAAHVMSHIEDPVAFLAALARMTDTNGRLVIFSHDGRDPGADLMFADVELSLCREHLGVLGARAGLELLDGPGIARPAGQLDKQVLVFQHSSSPRQTSPLTAATRDRLLEGRRRYFRAWEALSDRLAMRVRGARGPVLNFGASFWSLLLAAYCPEYWERVDACVVDDVAGTFLGKPMIRTESIPRESSPTIVLGVNPVSQAALAQRLAGRGEIVIWNDLVTR